MIVKDFLLDIFFPKRCVQCGKFGNYVCFDCAGKIERVKTPTCPECGRITVYGQYCPPCKRKINTELAGLIIAARYDRGPIKEMIHGFKYQGLTELGPMLGELIVERLKDRLPVKGTVPSRGLSPGRHDLLITPVPLHKKKQSQRGFNQAELIAKYVSRKLEIPGELVLERTRETDSQVKLSGEKRRQNLVGAFKINKPDLAIGRTILLVDDVTTTGSTLNECAKVLKTAGAKAVWGVAIARG